MAHDEKEAAEEMSRATFFLIVCIACVVGIILFVNSYKNKRPEINPENWTCIEYNQDNRQECVMLRKLPPN